MENRGLDHFRPSVDKSTWQWHQCHKHYHSMETFSSYDLISEYPLKFVKDKRRLEINITKTICQSVHSVKELNLWVRGLLGESSVR